MREYAYLFFRNIYYMFQINLEDCLNKSQMMKNNMIFKYLENNFFNQRTNGPVNAHLISWPSKAQNIQNLENIW